ncbi:MAG: DUF3791 domain-containing protein [Mediterranea sp.]|nr:DUF3791 domain-containing protein [Mediterranea sp.]
MNEQDFSNRIEYFVACIGAFAERYTLTNGQAYRYLKRFAGLDFLDEFYDIEHTFSIEEAIDDLTKICQRNGGGLG